MYTIPFVISTLMFVASGMHIFLPYVRDNDVFSALTLQSGMGAMGMRYPGSLRLSPECEVLNMVILKGCSF